MADERDFPYEWSNPTEQPVPQQTVGELWQWVKASEMFPIKKDYEDTGGRVFIRSVDSKVGGMILIDEFYKLEGKENIEWLSLYPSPTAPSDAIEFAEWVNENEYRPWLKKWFKLGTNPVYTTSELYEIFKQRPTTT